MNRKSTHAVTALYCRLSLEDGRKNESMSISNQKSMHRDYAERNGFSDYAYYVDDGYTGRNFNRPGFQRMIADIESGIVKCVITKDLSRLGRNYIEAGRYIDIFFPGHGVRYIAITDGVDSANSQEMDITPFKNILNDMYSRDISKKVLTGRMTRSRQGKFGGGPAPYGLMRDPNDHGHLIIDPETAPTVKLIADIRSHAERALKDSESFYAQLAKRLELRNCGDTDALRKEKATLEARDADIDRLFMNLYEDKTKGILTEQRFVAMTVQLESEQTQNKARIREIYCEISNANSQGKDIRLFMEQIKQYATIQSLDQTIVHRLIDRITIGEAHIENGEAVQRVKIAYNLVGDIV